MARPAQSKYFDMYGNLLRLLLAALGRITCAATLEHPPPNPTSPPRQLLPTPGSRGSSSLHSPRQQPWTARANRGSASGMAGGYGRWRTPSTAPSSMRCAPVDYEQFQEQFPAFKDPLVQDLYSGYKQVRPPAAPAAAPATRHCRCCSRVAALFGHQQLQALHHTRVNIEADFGELCEEHELRDKLNTLEVMCEEQGIGDGDAAEGARCTAAAAVLCAVVCGLALALLQQRNGRDVKGACSMLHGSPPRLTTLLASASPSRQPALGPTNAIRLSLLRAKQQELESLRGVLAEVEAHNARLQGQMAERRRQAQELIAKTQVGLDCGAADLQAGGRRQHAVGCILRSTFAPC